MSIQEGHFKNLVYTVYESILILDEKRRRWNRMIKLMENVKGFMKNEEGQGLIEYALLIALITLVVITALGVISKKVENTYNNTAQLLPN
jgi:pilus assembly protein Flp/PilA